MTINTFITREDKEIAITVEATYYPGCRGARDSLCGVKNAGPPIEPDSDPEFEIDSVVDENNNQIELTTKEEEKILEELASNYDDGRWYEDDSDY